MCRNYNPKPNTYTRFIKWAHLLTIDPALTKIVLAHVMIIHLSALFQRELTDTYEVVRCPINTRVDFD